MANILTLAEVRAHVENDLSDAAFQQIIDAADAEILRRLGPIATQSEVLEGGARFLRLAREISSITSIVERYSVNGIGYQNITLTSTDYSVLADNRTIERLFTGPTPADVFLGLVTFTYIPADTTAERKILLIKLVKLDANYAGIISDSIGDVRVQYMNNHAEEKAALFRALATGGRRFVW